MQLVPNNCTLRLGIELALPADLREVEISVRQYASQLCKDLALPVNVSVRITLAATKSSLAEPFRILLNGKSFPYRLWPAFNLPQEPSPQDIATLIAFALFDGRELLLTDEVICSLASDWCITDKNAHVPDTYTNGWTDGGFRHFAGLFPRYNFSLRHAQRSINSQLSGAGSEMDACCLFEQLLEDSPDVEFGAGVAVSQEEFSGYKAEYETAAAAIMAGLDFDLALLCPKIRLKTGIVRQDEFEVQINDVRLPVTRGLARENIILQSKPNTGMRRIEVLFDPLMRDCFSCVKGTPEMKSRPDAWTGGPADYMKLSLRLIMAANAGCLIMSPVVHLLLKKVEKNTVNLVPRVRATFNTGEQLYRWFTAVLRCLLAEQVPIGDLGGILESLLSLRDMTGTSQTAGVYHFSQLEDSPIRVAGNKTIAALCKSELVSAARLGVPSLSIRRQDYSRQNDALLPLPDQLQKAIVAAPKDESLSEWIMHQVFRLLNSNGGTHVALIADQSLRSEIKNGLRYNFSDVPVFGLGEIPKASLAGGYFLLGDSFQKQYCFFRAIDVNRRAICLRPERASYHARLAYVLAKQAEYVTNVTQQRNMYRESIAEYQMAIELDPKVAWFKQFLSLPLARLHLLEQACNSLREAIRMAPKELPAYLDLANYSSQQGKFDDAVEALETALRIDSVSIALKMDVARAYTQVGRFDDAVMLAEEVSQMEGSNKETASSLLVDLKKAQQIAFQLKTESPASGSQAELGNIQAKLGNLQAAANEYRNAITLDPSNPSNHKFLGNTLYKLDDWLGAAAAWEKVRNLDESDALNMNNLGTAYDGLEETDKAKSCYEKAAELAPDKFVPVFNLGSSNYRLKNFNGAKNAYSTSLKLNDVFPTTHFHVGNCNFRLSLVEDAVSEWLRVQELDPTNVEAHFNLGAALWSSPENRSEAIAHWKEALRLDSNLNFAEENLWAIAQDISPPHLEIFDLVHARGSDESKANVAAV